MSNQAAPHSQVNVQDTGLQQPRTWRIGMFSESFAPVRNGVTISLLTLTQELRAQGHYVCIFAPAHSQQPPDEPDVMRFPSFVSIFNRGYPLAYPFWPRIVLSSQFADLRLDIVHTHTPFVLGLTGARLALSHHVPLVSTFHTLYWQYAHYMPFLPEGVTNTLLDLYLPWYYNHCSCIICPSKVTENALRSIGVNRPITIIPTGIPLPPEAQLQGEAVQRARQRLEVPENTSLLLYVGRLASEKNVMWLLEVFQQVHAAYPNAVLAFVGEGPLQPSLIARAQELGLAEFVRFPGPIPRNELDAIYAAADVFCFPSSTETQGLVVGEARAAGLPSVVVNAGGAPETVSEGEDGFVVPVGDAEAFADRALRLLTDRTLAERMRRAARRNASRYTPSQMAQKVLEVYAEARRLSPPPRMPEPEVMPHGPDWEAQEALYEDASGNASTPTSKGEPMDITSHP
ncbi:glycosyltransferase [Chthonomonas calidirosea]|uniref:glycosyltransferase n=1 Tax=Chthonomonas calidirosea TaxID=454171 RepID=UPI0006ECBC64|nr:glycosyltransferase [Chthonomonas calidirosea]CEK17623.1 1,2-diacylglycerol 3-glucosyltransferase [Chthonomonas calidirosea]